MLLLAKGFATGVTVAPVLPNPKEEEYSAAINGS
jgi:hypothetical protein